MELNIKQLIEAFGDFINIICIILKEHAKFIKIALIVVYKTIYRVKLVKTEYVLNEKYFSISIRSQKYIFYDRNLTLAIIIKYTII